MTFGASSAIFQEWVRSVMGQGQTTGILPAGYGGLVADTIRVVLMGDTPTPDKDAALASTGYNTGQWLASSAKTDNPNWVTAGEPLTGKVLSDQGSGITRFDAVDTPQSGTTCTLAAVFGCFVYDDSITAGTGGVADQGITYHSLGGTQSVTAGTFTVVWHATGVFQITVT